MHNERVCINPGTLCFQEDLFWGPGISGSSHGDTSFRDVPSLHPNNWFSPLCLCVWGGGQGRSQLLNKVKIVVFCTNSFSYPSIRGNLNCIFHQGISCCLLNPLEDDLSDQKIRGGNYTLLCSIIVYNLPIIGL